MAAFCAAMVGDFAPTLPLSVAPPAGCAACSKKGQGLHFPFTDLAPLSTSLVLLARGISFLRKGNELTVRPKPDLPGR
jgi:hypothetical protein